MFYLIYSSGLWVCICRAGFKLIFPIPLTFFSAVFFSFQLISSHFLHFLPSTLLILLLLRSPKSYIHIRHLTLLSWQQFPKVHLFNQLPIRDDTRESAFFSGRTPNKGRGICITPELLRTMNWSEPWGT